MLPPGQWEHQRLERIKTLSIFSKKRKGEVRPETRKETHWWRVCQSEVDSPDCYWQHRHIWDTLSRASVQSEWSGSWSGAASHPLPAHRLSFDSECGIQWWQKLEPTSEQWRSWCECRRSPSQWESPELDDNVQDCKYLFVHGLMKHY